MVTWCLNRLIQSTGWAALVKVASNWFSYDRYGSVMGILSLSFLFGDAVARLFLGGLVQAGIGWRGVFFAAAGVLLLIALADAFVLKEHPKDVGEAEPQVNPNNLYGKQGEKNRPENLKQLLAPFLGDLSFWLVLVLSFGLTLIRETFNLWTPTYLTEIGHLSAGSAAEASLFFPFFGGISVLLGGFITDRYTKGRRGAFMTISLALLVAALGLLGTYKSSGGSAIPLLLISAVSLFMMAPYSFLSGVMALDLGGKQGSSTAAGFIDSAGYLSGIVSGLGIAALAERSGWNAAFGALAGVAVLMALTAAVYWLLHERRTMSASV
jgi:OPA family glycerol-3-phosphate transporter-like MFS transporter